MRRESHDAGVCVFVWGQLGLGDEHSRLTPALIGHTHTHTQTHTHGPTPILGLNWFQTPIKSQNWQQSFEINPFRTIS